MAFALSAILVIVWYILIWKAFHKEDAKVQSLFCATTPHFITEVNVNGSKLKTVLLQINFLIHEDDTCANVIKNKAYAILSDEEFSDMGAPTCADNIAPWDRVSVLFSLIEPN